MQNQKDQQSKRRIKRRRPRRKKHETERIEKQGQLTLSDAASIGKRSIC